ncbi:MAG TPA: IS1595 family transposase [Pyrinomonadaceae bacterium]|nr:IS1595 family transposase [Pyrinomonadaceae bacterium]
MDEGNFPKTLQEAIVYFSDPATCTTFMAQLRWPDGVTCPNCNGKAVSYLSTRRMWKCKNKECFKQFSVKVGTVMEDSPIKLDKWLAAIWMIANCKNGVSSYEIHRALGITQKSAWFLNHRIRLAMQTGTFEKLSGQVECDETYIGGLARNMHRDKREKKITGTGGAGKVAVMGLLERNGKVRAKVIANASQETLHGEVRQHVTEDAELFTDGHRGYNGLHIDYIHKVIDHAEKYVDGQIHTNGIENFWSLLKRGIKGTYVSVEPFHLFRYLDEQSFRFNERRGTDSERFLTVISLLQGKRLEYKQLTGQPSC